MTNIIDARGLSCPEPVLLTMEKIKKVKKGEIEVLVDTDTSKENVSRAAVSQGWKVVGIKQSGTGYELKLVKK